MKIWIVHTKTQYGQVASRYVSNNINYKDVYNTIIFKEHIYR